MLEIIPILSIGFISLMSFIVIRITYLGYKNSPNAQKEFKTVVSQLGKIFFIKNKSE